MEMGDVGARGEPATRDQGAKVLRERKGVADQVDPIRSLLCPSCLRPSWV